MATRRRVVSLVQVGLDASSTVPLYRQLYDQLREAILTKRLAGGARLPSTRALAKELGVSRNTVMIAFEQLLAEGYLEGRTGAGTFVASVSPDEVLYVNDAGTHQPQLSLEIPDHLLWELDRAGAGSIGPDRANGRKISKRGEILKRNAFLCCLYKTAPQPPPSRDGKKISRRGESLKNNELLCCQDKTFPRAFRVGWPAIEEFPRELWARLVARSWRDPPRELLLYGDPAGYRPLREAIAVYLREARGVRCETEQVIVVAGCQQGLDLAARVLLDPGDPVWIEDPGYLGARSALLGAGAELIPVPVDKDGLNVSAGIATRPTARAAYVSPSHQFPLGVTMSLARRLALLSWAKRWGGWVLEDDYDSEYRYAGRPVASIQGLDSEGRVIYLGSFSKVLLPSIRLGYVVVPPDLVDAFVAARSINDRHSPVPDQAVLARFMMEGHFARHIRRTRSLYAQRRAALLEAASRDLGGLLEIEPGQAGMHLLGWLPEGVDDRAASRIAATHGVEVVPLSAYAIEPTSRGGLLLGYAAVTEREISDAARRLAQALETLARTDRAQMAPLTVAEMALVPRPLSD